jgi:hypothetical protein
MLALFQVRKSLRMSTTQKARTRAFSGHAHLPRIVDGNPARIDGVSSAWAGGGGGSANARPRANRAVKTINSVADTPSLAAAHSSVQPARLNSSSCSKSFVEGRQVVTDSSAKAITARRARSRRAIRERRPSQFGRARIRSSESAALAKCRQPDMTST